jgi:hypothetical protein
MYGESSIISCLTYLETDADHTSLGGPREMGLIVRFVFWNGRMMLRELFAIVR